MRYTNGFECPKCSKTTLVQHTNDKYVCLNCNFKRDISHDWDFSNMRFPFILGLLGALVLTALTYSEPETLTPRLNPTDRSTVISMKF